MSTNTNGNSLILKAKLRDFSSVKNVSVQIHFIYSGESSWESKWMKYNSESGTWDVQLEKKGDTGTVYYWVGALDNGVNISGQYFKYGNETDPKSVNYSQSDGNYSALCLIGFFIAFIAFEMVMRYGIIRKRETENEENKKEKGVNEKEEGRENQDKDFNKKTEV